MCSLLCFAVGMLKEILGEERHSSRRIMVATGIMDLISSLVLKHATNPHTLHDWCNLFCGIAVAFQ